jgi:uncharacterized protein (DUF983 family)
MYDFGIRQALSGYRVAYRPGETNRCPGCGDEHWLVGRITAECAFCGTAIGIQYKTASGAGSMRIAA